MTTLALPRSTPEAQGIASTAILAFIEEAEQSLDALHSIMLLRHGHVVAEGWWAPYAPERPHMLFSLSKSFTSTAVGMAAAEGLLSLDDPVLPYFPEEAPAKPSKRLAAMKIRHLLSMSTGHTEDTTAFMRGSRDGNWAKAFLRRPVRRNPGTHFLYNTGATYMLSAIVQRVSGATLTDYLRPRLFDPLGIEYAVWESCPRGVNVGGFGLNITTDSIARFGQLYLQDGVWNGQRLLTEGWVAQASAAHISNGDDPQSDWAQGYGFQFWRCRHGAYRGDGAFGQYCIIMPEQDAVLAITSGLGPMQPPLDLVWKHLLPAMGPAPRAADPAAAEALTRKLAALAFMPQPGNRTSPEAAHVMGHTYTIEPNVAGVVSVRLDAAGDDQRITVRDTNGEHTIVCGAGRWIEGVTSLDRGIPRAVAASGAWSDDNTYVAQLLAYETPFRLTLTLRFAEDLLRFDNQINVELFPTERPQLVGRW
jgi:CubicO group peptidase (beta-lactamase class C family)